MRALGAGASAVLVGAALALAIVGGSGGGSPAADTAPQLVETAELAALESSLGHSVYWAGERPPDRIELRQEVDGSVYLRYLPRGVAVGDPRGAFLTVGTYPVADAQAAVRRAAAQAGTAVGRVRSGGIVLATPASAGSVYLAYPGSDLELEVYDPHPGRAMELIRSGAIRPVGEG